MTHTYYKIKRSTFIICCLQYYDEFDYDSEDWLKDYQGNILIFDSEKEAEDCLNYLKVLSFDLMRSNNERD